MTSSSPSTEYLRPGLARFAVLSICAAVVTITLKLAAWWLTGSVGLLSDALESVVNLVAAVFALLALIIAARPADDNHAYGHAKIEYVAAGVEGALILGAATLIGWTAIDRLLNPATLHDIGIGIAVSIVASLLNLAVGLRLIRVGREHRSVTLEADGRHLLTDVWTSAGVVIGVVLVAVTGIERLDPIVALAVAANIIYVGITLMRRALSGLMDEAAPPEQLARITEILDELHTQDLDYHALRTRTSGHRTFMSVHVLVPGDWTVQQGHDEIEQLEARLRKAVPALTVVTHLEPIEDETSFRDIDITP